MAPTLAESVHALLARRADALATIADIDAELEAARLVLTSRDTLAVAPEPPTPAQQVRTLADAVKQPRVPAPAPAERSLDRMTRRLQQELDHPTPEPPVVSLTKDAVYAILTPTPRLVLDMAKQLGVIPQRVYPLLYRLKNEGRATQAGSTWARTPSAAPDPPAPPESVPFKDPLPPSLRAHDHDRPKAQDRQCVEPGCRKKFVALDGAMRCPECTWKQDAAQRRLRASMRAARGDPPPPPKEVLRLSDSSSTG